MLVQQLKEANINALKAHDTTARSVLSVILNKVKLAEIDRRSEGKELSDADVVSILQKSVKELTEEREAFEKANRPENVAVLTEQIAFVNKFLPQMMSAEEIRAEIDKIDDKSVGSVMKYFKANFAGKVDMRDVQNVLKNL